MDTLGTYIYNSVMNLPSDKRPNQRPIRKVEAGGEIILAQYPELAWPNEAGARPPEEHLIALLVSGKVEEFNISRGQKSARELHLSGSNLVGAKLRGVNISGVDLSGTAFTNADLTNADLSDANLTGAHLSEANLSGAKLSGVNLQNANLYHANLSNANLTKARLSEANLIGATMVKADLSEADLSKSNFVGADLSQTNFDRSDLSDTRLMFADLAHAENLRNANLKGSDLTKSKNLPISKADARRKGAIIPYLF